MPVPPDTTDVLRLWAAVLLLSLLEVWAWPGEVRGAPGALYVAANLLVFFAAVLLLAHAAARAAEKEKPPPALGYVPVLLGTDLHNTRAELTHLFLHVLCAAYLRTACWFELRALFYPTPPVRAVYRT